MVGKSEPSPMMAQYLHVKDQYPGYLVLFRVGDFFETFGEDARQLSSELDIVLTSRQMDGTGQKIPLAGVPHHALETYLARLVRKGHGVVICDQVEDPKRAKGLVKREVTRIVTPGTVLEESLLPTGANNYLAASYGDSQNGYAVTLVDVSTGETIVKVLSAGEDPALLVHDVAALTPSEVLVCDDPALSRLWENSLPGVRIVNEGRPSPADPLPEAWREVASLSPAVATSLAIAGSYVRRCEPRIVRHLTRPILRRPGERLSLDMKTLRHLEVTEPMNPSEGHGTTLLSLMNVATTPPGRRTVEAWLRSPLAELQGIESRLQGVASLVGSGDTLTLLRTRLKGVGDLSRLSGRVVTRRATPRDLLEIGRSLRASAEVKVLAAKLSGTSPLVSGLVARIDPAEELCQIILSSIVEDPPTSLDEGGVLRAEAFPALAEVRSRERTARTALADLERREAEASGIRNLKIGYTQVFGYYFDVTRPNLARVPHERWKRKQTLASGERFTSEELGVLEREVLALEEEARGRERTLWDELIVRVESGERSLQETSEAVGELDALCAFAEIARGRRWVRPKVHEGSAITIREGRHPVLDNLLGPRYVPNDTELDTSDRRLLLLTGPNMAGKSTYMRQVGLLVLLAQAGSFVPARYAEIGLVSHLATRMGFTDDIGHGKSSFMVEMSEVAEILVRANSRSLILLDEVGRGTSTSDGLALAWAIVKHLHGRVKARTVIATHYHQLSVLVDPLPAARNAHLAVKEEEGRVTFLRTLLPGATDKSYGIHVADMAGLPEPIIKDAKSALREMEGWTGGPPGEAGAGRQPSRRYTQGLLLKDVEGEEAKRLVEELRTVDANAITPLEALTLLHDLVRKAGRREEPAGSASTGGVRT